jgi:hypothetical protein
MLMQAVYSPFLYSGNVKLWDLKTAIGICRLKYRQSKIRRPFFPRFVTKSFFKKEVDRFVEYIGDYSSNLDYNIIPFDTGRNQKPEPRIVHPPNVVITAFDAAHGARVSIVEAWNMPLGEAYIAQAMHFREQGSRVSFMDDAEREFQKELKKGMNNGSN